MVFADSLEGTLRIRAQGTLRTWEKAISIRHDSRQVCTGEGFPKDPMLELGREGLGIS